MSDRNLTIQRQHRVTQRIGEDRAAGKGDDEIRQALKFDGHSDVLDTAFAVADLVAASTDEAQARNRTHGET